MIDYTLRLPKRFAVLLPGIIIAYFSVRDIYPFVDKKVPAYLAVLLTYVVAAYILIPTFIRIVRVVIPARHLPLYCVTPDGFASDPINIGILGSRRELVAAMNASGWYTADARTIKNLTRATLGFLFDWPYRNAPMSNLYLFGRRHDIAFEIPLGGRGHRHHVRFWATTYKNDKITTARSIHWHKRRREHIPPNKNLLWVGAASRDIGLSFIRHNAQITHMIDPDTNSERDLIIQKLEKINSVKSIQKIYLGEPYKLVNRVWRGQLHTDGKMAVVKLKA